MKNRNIINIPPTIKYLSEFTEFDSLLDRGRVIVNKEVCGCGATEYYLRCPYMPVLLLSPRKMLIETKMDSNPTDHELQTGIIPQSHRPFKVWYFDRSNGNTPAQSISDLIQYLNNPLQLPNFIPKVLVTYDSFPIVFQTLVDLGWADYFTIVVDEFTSLFTDVRMKGTKELEIINLLTTLPNHIVYISATPLKDKYLNAIPAFNGVKYYDLNWDASRLQRVRVRTEPMKSTVSKIAQIITEFRERGFFKSTIISGQEVYSTEAVFYVNSVADIVRVINKCGLTPDDTLVLCADDSENRRKLSRASTPFTIARPVSYDKYKTDNKPFTLVTRVCFEGADLYSDCSSVYVFSDASQENLSLDISIDLPQIAGRCRSDNPFKNEIRLYYKTSDAELIQKAKSAIEARESKTIKMLPHYNCMTDIDALDPIIEAQKAIKYSKYYLDVEVDRYTGQAKVVVNELARQADLRALDIKKNQYRSGYSVHYFANNTSRTTPYDHPAIQTLWDAFTGCKDFSSLMRLYVQTIEAYPELKSEIETSLTEIPAEYKKIYNAVGPDTIKACGYAKSEIMNLINSQNIASQSLSALQKRLYELLPSGDSFTNAEVKAALATVYAEFKISYTPKATDIVKYIQAQPGKVYDKNRQRKDGYKIL